MADTAPFCAPPSGENSCIVLFCLFIYFKNNDGNKMIMMIMRYEY